MIYGALFSSGLQPLAGGDTTTNNKTTDDTPTEDALPFAHLNYFPTVDLLNKHYTTTNSAWLPIIIEVRGLVGRNSEYVHKSPKSFHKLLLHYSKIDPAPNAPQGTNSKVEKRTTQKGQII